MDRSAGRVWDPHLWGYVKACWASPPSHELWKSLMGRLLTLGTHLIASSKKESLKCTFSERFGKGHGCRSKKHGCFAWMRAHKLSGGWMHLLGRRNVGKPLALFSVFQTYRGPQKHCCYYMQYVFNSSFGKAQREAQRKGAGSLRVPAQSCGAQVPALVPVRFLLLC